MKHMKRLLLIIFPIIILSCSIKTNDTNEGNQRKNLIDSLSKTNRMFDLFSEIENYNNSKLVIITGPVFNKYRLLDNNELILKYKNDFKFFIDSDCINGTTPEYQIQLLRNGKVEKIINYCDSLQPIFLTKEIQKQWKDCIKKEFNSNYEQLKNKLESLNKKNNVYILSPSDSTLMYGYELRIGLRHNTNINEIEFNNKTKNEFKKIFSSNINIHFIIQSVQGNIQNTEMIIDCQSQFLKQFDKEKLLKSEYFKDKFVDVFDKEKILNCEYYEWK